jgi:putative methionine-R-sulfoxide reductase with GAF domain
MPAERINRVFAPLLTRARRSGTREVRIKKVVDALWESFSRPMHPPEERAGAEHRHPAISWVGVYTKVEGRDEMVLGYCRNKPACSPIGFHGVCGRGLRDRRAVLVADVKTLGENYIACDPLDKSELVVPLLADDGSCWGVLDADSHEVDAFDERDAAGMTVLLQRFGLTNGSAAIADPLRL